MIHLLKLTGVNWWSIY